MIQNYGFFKKNEIKSPDCYQQWVVIRAQQALLTISGKLLTKVHFFQKNYTKIASRALYIVKN
jgi:hypothetical protein